MTVDSSIHSSRSNKAGRERNAERIDIGQNVYGKPCHEVFKTFCNIKEGDKGKMQWKRIHVFKPEKRSEKSNTRRENEKLDTIQCLKPELSRIVSGSSSAQRGLLIKQTSTIPLRLANEHSSLYNSGDKSQVMKLFEDSYPRAFSDRLEFSPDWIIMELMILKYVAPRSTHKTFDDWGEFLWSIYISPWLAFAGSTVCLLSDHPKKDSIKSLERQRRIKIDKDQTINVATNSDTPGNEMWWSVLANAGNKRAVCELLGHFFLRKDDLYHLIKGFLFQSASRGKMPIAVFRLIVKMSIRSLCQICIVIMRKQTYGHFSSLRTAH